MRILKIIFVALVVGLTAVAGVFVAAAAVVAGSIFFFLHRMGLRSRPSAPLLPNKKRNAAARNGDVIDVTATEVPGELLPR